MCAKTVKGKRVAYAGNYGETYYELPPIPENPPTIVDHSGREWLYCGDIDEYTVRVAQMCPDGRMQAYPYSRYLFPCLD